MQFVRRFLTTILIPALIVSIFAVGAAAAHGSDGKVNLCHWANHKFVKVTVATSARSAHLQHGDVEPDEYGDCSGDQEGDHEGSDGDNEAGEHDGHDGDSKNCQGSRAKSSHVKGSWTSSGKAGQTQGSKVRGDKALSPIG